MRTHLHDKLANPIHPFQIQERSPAAFKTHCTANNTSQQYKNTFGVKYSKNTMNKNTFITSLISFFQASLQHFQSNLDLTV